MKKLLARLVLYRTDEEVDFSFGYFIAFVLIQTLLFMAAVYTICHLLKRDLIEVQFATSLPLWLLCFTLMHLVMSLFEYLFHRYTLHKVAVGWLATFKRKHTEHHSLTHVRDLKHKPNRIGQVQVRNKLAITEPNQIRSSAFPAYALITFWGVFSLMIWPLQLLLPSLPILSAGYLAVVFSFSLYEILHAIMHLDYDKYWHRKVEQSLFVRKVYGFHAMHHSNELVNQAIGGFFGLPIWDWIFGTYFVPEDVPLPEAWVRPETQKPPRPRWLVRMLDLMVKRLETRFIKRQKKTALARHNVK